MSIELVAIDMDGTLLKDNKSLDNELTNKVFNGLNNKGIKVLINSGNSVKKLHSYFDEQLLDFMYFGGDDGNFLVQDGTIVHEIGYPKSLAVEILNKYDHMKNKHYVVSTGLEAYTKPFKNEADKKEVYTYYDEVNFVDKWEDIPDKEIVKMEFLSRQSLQENKVFTKQIMEDFPQTSAVSSGDDWVDVYNKDGGKGQSVKYLQDKYQISKEETIAFGDSYNDASMLVESNYRCGMANADPELIEEYCNYKILSNNEEGVQQILSRFLEEGNLDCLEKYKI